MFLDENILSIFEAGFTNNLSIFEPQIEKRYAYTCIAQDNGPIVIKRWLTFHFIQTKIIMKVDEIFKNIVVFTI